jgi:hypothetical protein
MKSLQLVSSMKLSLPAAFTAASLLLSCPAAFSQPVTKLEVIHRNDSGLVLCESKGTAVGKAVALLRIDGQLACVEIGMVSLSSLPLPDWLDATRLVHTYAAPAP